MARLLLILALVLLAYQVLRDSERNERVQEINHTANRVIDLLEGKWLPRAKTLADIPPEWRQSNWGTGSCVHATTVSLLRWQGLYEIADEWRRTYSGEEATAQEPHTAKMEHFGLKYVVTTDGDDSLLDWAIATRRGAGVTYPRGHCVAVIGKEVQIPTDPRYGDEPKICAVILDNNHVNYRDYLPWHAFLEGWRDAGGKAFAFTSGQVPPPTPKTGA